MNFDYRNYSLLVYSPVQKTVLLLGAATPKQLQLYPMAPQEPLVATFVEVTCLEMGLLKFASDIWPVQT